jgi:hypothetical protein
MGLPSSCFHDLGQGRPLWPSDQFQDLGTLALGARRAGFLGMGGFGFLPALPSFFGAALAFPPLAAFWPLGALFFGLAPLFEEVFSGATGAPCSATAAVFSARLASAFVTVVNPLNPFCA